MYTCNAVFEGGGVKGIALAGAAAAFMDKGYTFSKVCGNSAGAIVASLIASGYDSNEIHQIMRSIDYKAFRQEDLLDRIGVFGKALSIAFEYGIYSADFFEEWLGRLLHAKGIFNFGNLKNADGYRFRAIASDLCEHRLLVLPDDLSFFGIDPDTFPVEKAVRMSMSIPVYFEPYKLRDIYGNEHIIVDGGLLSNYPIWLLDDGQSSPALPTFGFKLCGEDCGIDPHRPHKKIRSIVDYSKALIATLLDAHDNFYISNTRGDFSRSVLIDTTVSVLGVQRKIAATDFDITPIERDLLYKNGYGAASRFLSAWDFDSWKAQFRHPAAVLSKAAHG